MRDFALANGVNPKVWNELTDPGLMVLLHKMMTESSQPDAIETVKTKTKAKKQKVRNLRERDEAGRFMKARKAMLNARSPTERKAAAQAMERQRLEREYGR